MGRGRLAMKLIEIEKSRKATFQKRKNGIMKKAHELSTLCGVDCCLIVYSPNSIDDLPHIWPTDPIEVLRIIDKYEAKKSEKSPKKYNVMDFFKDRKNKVEAEACKLQKERLRKLYPTWHLSFDKLGEEQLRIFVALLDSKIQGCKERINMLKKKRYLERKQQGGGAESSSDKSASAAASNSNRSHLSFMHNNTATLTLSAQNHQTLDFPLNSNNDGGGGGGDEDHLPHRRVMLHPFHPNLMMPLMMITQNDSAATQIDACVHYDLMRESYPSYSSIRYYNNNNNNNNNYHPHLQNNNNNNNNNMQFYHHEANLQVHNPTSVMMMQEFQTHHLYGYHHHDMLQVHQKFNYSDQKK